MAAPAELTHAEPFQNSPVVQAVGVGLVTHTDPFQYCEAGQELAVVTVPVGFAIHAVPFQYWPAVQAVPWVLATHAVPFQYCEAGQVWPCEPAVPVEQFCK